MQDLALPFLHLKPKPALGDHQRRLPLELRLGLDQVGKAFRLGQVDADRVYANSRRVNSPGRASFRPSMLASSRSTASTTARPPWH